MIIAVVEDRTLSILAGTFAATIAAKDIEYSFQPSRIFRSGAPCPNWKGWQSA
jgi:hypothetical protein